MKFLATRTQKFTLLLVLALVAAAAWGPIVSQVDEPDYTVERKDGSIELRAYAPMVVAEVRVDGERYAAINQGFRLLADYIFGNNAPGEKLAMTAPVVQQAGEKLAMTAPVAQQPEGSGWRVHFVMPKGSTLDSLPKPNRSEVVLRAVPESRYAVIRFSGRNTDANLSEQESLLQAWLKNEKLTAKGSAVYAFYNPPWTLPFLRRNEVMVEVE